MLGYLFIPPRQITFSHYRAGYYTTSKRSRNDQKGRFDNKFIYQNAIFAQIIIQYFRITIDLIIPFLPTFVKGKMAVVHYILRVVYHTFTELV